MKENSKIEKRFILEYMLTAIIIYVIKTFAMGYFEEIQNVLAKGCFIVGAILWIVAFGMLLHERKTKNDFVTGDPVFQYKFNSDEEYEQIKRDMPSAYWYSRATLERQYTVVSVGVLAGLGVGIAAWNHVIFILFLALILAIWYLLKNK